MEYAVLLYQQGGLWCAEVPDLDSSGAHAATAESVLGACPRIKTSSSFRNVL